MLKYKIPQIVTLIRNEIDSKKIVKTESLNLFIIINLIYNSVFTYIFPKVFARHVSGIAPDVLWTRKNLLTHDLCYKCVIYKRKRS